MEWLKANLTKIILGVGIAVCLAIVVKNYAEIKKFVDEVKTELKKVAWSTRQELAAATLMVIAITGLLALFVGSVDVVFSKALSVVIK